MIGDVYVSNFLLPIRDRYSYFSGWELSVIDEKEEKNNKNLKIISFSLFTLINYYLQHIVALGLLTYSD